MEVRLLTRVRRIIQAVRYDLRPEIPSVPCDAEGNPRVKNFNVKLFKIIGNDVPVLYRTTKLRYRRKSPDGKWTAWIDKQDSDTISVQTGVYVLYEIEAYHGGSLLTSLGVSTTLDGRIGNKGAKQRVRVWDRGHSYLQGKDKEDWYDIALYRDDATRAYEKYLCLVSHGPRNITPKEDVAQRLGYWALASEFEFIATRLLLAERITADQIDATGLCATNADISGKITATKGEIGAFNIESGGLSNVSDNPNASIRIEKNGGRRFVVNSGDSSPMCAIRGDEGTALSVSAYGTNSTGIELIAQAGRNTTALRSYGNVNLIARDSEAINIHGLCLNCRTVNGSASIGTDDDVIVVNNSQWAELTMPANAQAGKILFIKQLTGTGVKFVNAGIYDPTGNSLNWGYTLNKYAHAVLLVHLGDRHWAIMNGW